MKLLAVAVLLLVATTCRGGDAEKRDVEEQAVESTRTPDEGGPQRQPQPSMPIELFTEIPADDDDRIRPEEPRAEVPVRTRERQNTEIQMSNVRYYALRNVPLLIDKMRGQLVPQPGYSMPVFDLPTSFKIRVFDSMLAISPRGMATLMNNYVLDDEAPLADLSMEAIDEQLRIEGTLKRPIPVTFDMLGVLVPTDEGDVRFMPEQIEVAGLRVKDIMEMLSIETAEIINLRRTRGMWIESNAMVLDPEIILPPPKLEADVRGVAIEGGRIWLELGAGDSPAKPLRPPLETENYMYFRGGVVRFGKLVMLRTDLMLTDLDPSDPLGFFLKDYNRQLATGYTQTASDLGLLSFIPDWESLPRKSE